MGFDATCYILNIVVMCQNVMFAGLLLATHILKDLIFVRSAN